MRMCEEDCSFDTPAEPRADSPKVSVITSDVSSRNRKSPYKNLKVLKVLSDEKFPVFLVNCETKLQNYALKIFQQEKFEDQACFLNEVRFMSLDHPNITKIVFSEQNKTLTDKKGKSVPISYILTEFAPRGDFLNFLRNYGCYFHDILARTYFKQLIAGLEFLHSKSVVHLDLKLENLLLGEDFTLKITDFDLSGFESDANYFSKGTRNYRAPEMLNSDYKDGRAVDIYSAGIILFALKTGGIAPYMEGELYHGVDLYHLLTHNTKEFWKKHAEIQQISPLEFSCDFKMLVNGMLKQDPEQRLTLREIKNSRWYNGPVFNKQELQNYFKKSLK